MVNADVTVDGKAYTPAMAYEAVTRGAAWLDKHCPDWVSHINLKRLDLGSNTFCMLGQTAKCLLPDKKVDGRAMLNGFGKVERWFQFMNPDEGEVRWIWTTPGELGFNCPTWLSSYGHKYQNVVFEMLTIAWREIIRERLEKVNGD